MTQQILVDCGIYKLLEVRKSNVAKMLSGILVAVEPEVNRTLECIKAQFPGFTEHGIQHSLRIMNYIYSIMSKELKDNISDIEIFCFIMSAFFHDMGMTLADVEDKDKQRTNHHFYAEIPIKEFFERNIEKIPENHRLEKCIIFVCKAHGRTIKDLYNDTDFKMVETIEGQTLRYGLLAILLRIGDLMDLEESRVCEFNMHINAAYYSDPESILHNRHHLDEISYNYNSKKITIKVRTDSREKYKIWEQWLSYLDNEVMYANTHYLTNDNSDFFLHYKFPEVVKEVKPSENADFSVEEIRFQVDENGTLWDILTKSIYTNEFDYIRELVQNAIDATLLKMYSDTNVSLPHQSPRSWNCTDKVMIAYSQKDGVLWVEDYGIGMNEKELSNYLFKTAKSGYQNMGKRTFEFPAIAKFGIGFASCLTKADEIQVITKSKEDKCVKAEIESNSTVAFIEKNVKRDWQGTTIILKVKEKYRFSELKNYINTYFRYPSVEIQLVNVDILDSYIDKDIIFNDKIIQIIEKANHQRNEILSDFLPDRQCLNKLRKILLKNENKKEVLSKIYDVLDNVFHKSYVKENLLDYIRKTEQMNDCINLVRKEVDREIEESEEKIEKYPGFLTVLCQLDLEKTVGYNQLIFEIDNTFDIKEVYKEKKKDSSDRGILFVFTDFADYDLGIEWHSVNAFLFQKNKIVSNFVKFETDLSEESDRNIFSLEEITNADYEISEKLHEPEMEEYYEEYFGGDNEEFYDNPYFCCDVILLNNNNFYFLTSVYEFEIDKITKSNDIIKDYSLGNTIVFPDEYKDECGLFKDSKLYQDGILLDILPQCIVPIGVTYVSVNLTGKSRFELNVSRHELNKNREVIKKWGQKAGKIIQRKVVQNCKQVFEENGLEYDQEDLLVAKGNDDFAKECYENMKNILSEVEG